jgi:PAS domain S-box-containing protein
MDGTIVAWNASAERLFGYAADEIVGRSAHVLLPPGAEDELTAILETIRSGARIEHRQSVRVRKDGFHLPVSLSDSPLRDAEGRIVGVSAIARDVSEQRAAEERFEKVFLTSLVAIGIGETDSGRLVDVNERCAEFFGYTRAEMIGRTVFELGLWVNPADREQLAASATAEGPGLRMETAFRCKSGAIRHALVSMEEITLAGISVPLNIVVLVDVAERKELESQLLQAQKMEAVGRLAGGVAHDFNNSLGVILGYTELLMRDAQEPQWGKLAHILKATQRASVLTRQLLAFSRKQIVDPRVLDLNVLLTDLQTMLSRLIGEDVDLAIVAGAELGHVKADAGQLQQVVMNLCVNARDAMPQGGLLRIETSNEDLDGSHVNGHEPVVSGRYVMVAVSDTGAGIPKDIVGQIFEPFFTTKELGKGTGLGLAMVYGIVKQAGGYVWVYSEVGRGTSFKIYLPRIDDPLEHLPALALAMPARGSETILLVEDEGSLRAIAREILEEHGYRVIDAPGPSEAIEMAGAHPGEIHLLVTDVVMPGMNGRVLAQALVATRPALRVLYMSGYTDDVIAQSGVLDSGTLLLEKPFTARALLGRVRAALGPPEMGADA